MLTAFNPCLCKKIHQSSLCNFCFKSSSSAETDLGHVPGANSACIWAISGNVLERNGATSSSTTSARHAGPRVGVQLPKIKKWLNSMVSGQIFHEAVCMGWKLNQQHWRVPSYLFIVIPHIFLVPFKSRVWGRFSASIWPQSFRPKDHWIEGNIATGNPL